MTLAEEVVQAAGLITPHDEPINKTYPKHATIWDLWLATKQFFNGKNIEMAPTVRIYDIDLVPFLGTGMLVVMGEAKGLAAKHSETSEHHIQVMRFMGVKFSEGPQDGFLEATYKKKKMKFWFKPLQQKVNPVDVTCTCGDFQYRFAYYIDRRFQALATKLASYIKNYQRKTPPPPEGRPYVNPGHLPGMCKHLLALTNTLVRNKALR